MSSNYVRKVPVYQGKVQACVFDWAGTVCDAGVFAPVVSFQRMFEQEGVPITDAEVRPPMGVHKRVHIKHIIETPSVVQRWEAKKGKAPTEDDVDRIYSNYLNSTDDILIANSKLIKGVPETMEKLREMGCKIGSSTGYIHSIMDKLKPVAAVAGYAPDCYVNSEEVPTARPSPAMIFLNMIKLDVWHPKAVIKVDDTASGITAGCFAGCWTVGVAKTGNYVGKTEDEMERMDPMELERLVKASREKLYDAGAHYVVDTVNDLPAIVEDVNRRLASGLSP